ncbi:hypothetical protein [Streptomyces sp. NPDC056683]|uniref:hypothetical protein n=1 Tax=Streptomyces sp. NPDC056683 TaxID=3345910 RepID=UPI00368E242D
MTPRTAGRPDAPDAPDGPDGRGTPEDGCAVAALPEDVVRADGRTRTASGAGCRVPGAGRRVPGARRPRPRRHALAHLRAETIPGRRASVVLEADATGPVRSPVRRPGR